MTTTLPAPSRPEQGLVPAQPGHAPHDQRHLVLSLVSMTAVILASLSLNGVIEGWLWLPPVILTVGCVSAAMAVVRSLGFPGPLIFVAGLLTLIGVLNWQYFPDQSILGLIPGPDTPARVTLLLNDAEDTVVSQLAPVLPDAGILLVISATIGLIAVLVDTSAITLKMPAASGIILLMILIPAAIIKTDSIGIPAFIAAGTGYLLLLAVAQWQERPSRTAGTRRSSDGHFTRAVSIGAATLSITIVLPLLVPGFNSGLFPQGSRLNPWGAATGLNPSVTLGNDLRNPTGFGRITYATNAVEPLYLRSSTLEDFSGQRWEPDQRLDSRRTGIEEIVADEPSSDGSPILTMITTQSFTSPWLLAPYAPTSVTNLEGRWTWDPQNLTILAADGGSTAEQSYQVRSSIPKLTRDLLAGLGPVPDGEVSEEFITLPDDIPATIETTVRGLTAETANPFYKAMAIQNYLRSEEFTYSLEAPVEGGFDGSGLGVIERFLDVKAGYCVHFAGTMAVMARLVGIPSRVAVGYAPGTPTGNTFEGPRGEDLTEFAVDSRDAHAWPELYFRDVGWVKFEPTPGRGAVPDYAQTQQFPPEALTDDNLTPRDSPRSAAEPPTTPAAAPAQSGGPDDGDGFAQGWAVTAVMLLLALVSVTPFLRRRARSARRCRLLASGTHKPARMAWAETTEIAGDYGYLRVPSDTPRSFAERLMLEAALGGQATVSLSKLQCAYEIEEYAPIPAEFTRQTAETLPRWEDVQTVIGALRSSTKLSTRFKAQLLPHSLRHPFPPNVKT